MVFLCYRLEASPLGGNTFYVQESKKGCSSGHTATVHWGKSDKTPTMKCTCEGPQKMLLPCRHVLAAAIGVVSTFQKHDEHFITPFQHHSVLAAVATCCIKKVRVS